VSSMRALSSIRTYQRHGVHAQEQFRAILAGDRDEAAELLDRWCSRAQRSRLEPFSRWPRPCVSAGTVARTAATEV